MQQHLDELIQTDRSTSQRDRNIKRKVLPWLDDFQPLLLHPPQGDRYWAFGEFAHVQLSDQRLKHRLQRIATDFAQQPLAAIPQACGSWSQSKAAYRFFDNVKVNFAAILAAHQQSTLQRLRQAAASFILCPQDTTALNYHPHPATTGLGPVGTAPGKSLGLLLHSTLAVSPQGEFLGVLDAKRWVRPNRKKSRRARPRHRKALVEKESVRWLESFRHLQGLAAQLPTVRLVSMTDREGDLYELLAAATAPDNPVSLLVRARHERALVGGRRRRLFNWLRRQPAAGTYTLRVPRHEDQPARWATLALRFGPVHLKAPGRKAEQPSLPLWGIWAEEIDPPSGLRPIRWCLLSTIPVRTVEEAIQQLQWYAKRWTIEEFHRVLKSGCTVEARQLTTRTRLERALAVDIVVAWRVLNLIKAARVQPAASAEDWLTREEWQALYCYVHEVRQAPGQAPSVREVVEWLARLGGWLGRKSDGPPGPKTLWRGLHRLKDIAKSWRVFGPQEQRRSSRLPTAAPRKGKRCG